MKICLCFCCCSVLSFIYCIICYFIERERKKKQAKQTNKQDPILIYSTLELYFQANKKAQSHLSNTLEQFQDELKKQQYYGDYFARSASEKLRLCCDKGWFSCEGPYDEENCFKLHKINPYGSKESRVLFSTWNLDHV